MPAQFNQGRPGKTLITMQMKPVFNDPPRSEADLLQRVNNLSGKTFQQVAREIGITVPPDQKYAKGWVGEVSEIYLGATAASLPEPDFQYINIELKTIPIGRNGAPRESTYVCTVPLVNIVDLHWEDSPVRRKLSRVLWLPVEGDHSISFAHRRFGSAFIWSPDAEEESILRNDWEELMEMVSMGTLDGISSFHGQYLQIRPKAANAGALGKAFDNDGVAMETLPRGFYLRALFTKKLLALYGSRFNV